MNEQRTDKKILAKGIRFIMFAMPLLFLGPAIIHSALKNKQHVAFYFVFALACLVCIGAVTLFYKGIQTIMKSLFGK